MGHQVLGHRACLKSASCLVSQPVSHALFQRLGIESSIPTCSHSGLDAGVLELFRVEGSGPSVFEDVAPVLGVDSEGAEVGKEESE